MKIRHIATAIAATLLTVGLVPLGSASERSNIPEGIEVITVVGKRPVLEDIEVITVVGKRPAVENVDVFAAIDNRPVPEGIEVITVVGERPEPTVASVCVNEIFAGNRSDYTTRDSVRQAIRDCIANAEPESTHS